MRSDDTFAKSIEAAACGKPILGICVAEFQRGIGDRWTIGSLPHDTVLKWDDVRPFLDKPWDWDWGYGSAGCPAVTAWTEDRVIFVHEYDGSTGVVFVPRNPVDGQPCYGGF